MIRPKAVSGRAWSGRRGRQERVNEVVCGAELTFAEDGANDKADVGRSFAKPTHEIRKPLATERNVNADSTAFRDQCRLKIATDAVQHLELEPICGNPLSCG